MGGGTATVVDLASAVVEPTIRATRLKRQRLLALSAAEALMIEARRRWALARRRDAWDDVTALVVVFEQRL